ncbi:U1 snRNP component [Phaffia rhodozyma]|uniref:U1 snRNP component n=1 Tax=Phaffia rhodozyma TaxID=264483 RepID=A0A0F7ST67_PHARH|nr:U1 snRNP component [Phaffia rhodozyma]
MPSDRPDTPAIQALRESLNKTFRISIQDGRTFTGTFICTDKTKNIILDQTTESKPTAGDQGPRFERDVGMVMIPWKNMPVDEFLGDMCGKHIALKASYMLSLWLTHSEAIWLSS